MRKFLIVGAATAVLLGGASQVSAATVIINSSSLASTAYKVHIGGTVDGVSVPFPNVFESPELMNITVGGGPAEDIVAFCVDIFHQWSPTDAPATYVTDPVTHNSHSTAAGGGTIIPNLISGEIGYLAGLGQSIADRDRLAGIQGAIWAIEYPNITLTGPNASSYLNYYVGLATTWGANHPNFQGAANGLFPLNTQTGGFGFTQVFTGGGVPEPATWALMIGGLGIAGAALRRRRNATA